MPIPALTKSVNGLSCRLDRRGIDIGIWERFIEGVAMSKSAQIVSRIEPFIKGKVLDVGMGAGAISCALARRSHDLVGVDVADLSMYSDLRPLIYDGVKLPFRDRYFGTSLLIHVLHHCGRDGRDNLRVLREAKRVSRRVVLIEDTYRNWLEKQLVSLGDMIGNAEFFRHNYLKSEQWLRYFKKMRWRVTYFREYSEMTMGMLYGRYCMFVIE